MLIGFGLNSDALNPSDTVECGFSFSSNASGEKKEMQPVLKESHIRFYTEKEGSETVFSARKSSKSINEKIERYALTDNHLQRPEINSLEYEITRPNDTALAGVSFSHFLPKAFTKLFDEFEGNPDLFIKILTNQSGYLLQEKFDSEKFGKAFKEAVLLLYKEILDNADPHKRKTSQAIKTFEAVKADFSFENIQNFLTSLYKEQKEELKRIVAEKASDLQEIMKESSNLQTSELRFAPLSGRIHFAVETVRNFFTEHLKYLGPLREEPKPVYPLGHTMDSRDVGIRGEHTAAVLNTHSSTVVEYIPSGQFAADELNLCPKSSPLSEALLDWLDYMGIVSDVKTADMGNIGVELKVSLDDGFWHDLTHVGIGVSQVLPIVVSALLADKGTALIFEQPELHLHPRVQTRLADFFLSMAILKKQCIVETHSEYLVNRLRYRSVIAEGNQISDALVIFFVERKDGCSAYQEIKINEFGVIKNWPRGFCDENEENAAKTLKAAMEKRKRKSGKRNSPVSGKQNA